MGYKAVFKRYEIKYIISLEQKKRIARAIGEHMALDRYGRTAIRNVYFDTDSYRLIRRSIEKPIFKEKLRIRSYGRADRDSDVFVEIKRKYDSVVYKRRVSMTESEAIGFICRNEPSRKSGQIISEIEYFKSFYGQLLPKAFLSYEREAFFMRDGGDFRVTFDDNILFRDSEITLDSEAWGESLLADGLSLMELKCSGGIPLWMTDILSREKIYKTSFSKYGEGYKRVIFPKLREMKKDNNIKEIEKYVV